MKKILSFVSITTIMAMSFVLPAPHAQAAVAPNWDTTGAYVVSFDGYNHDMYLVQDGMGTTTGNGGWLAGTLPFSFAWTITSGIVSGNDIHLTADYTYGAIGTTMHMVGVIAPDGSMSGTWSDNYGGGVRTGTWSTVVGIALPSGVLSAEDFGVVNYDTGLGILKGYTAGFGLTHATFASSTSVVVQLYGAGDVLLQTNTLNIANTPYITGTQISSPFDVSGNFNYVTDGYWTNVRESQFGQSVPAVKVVATVTLADGKIVTAENTILVGDPTTIYPVVTPPTITPTKDTCKNGGWKTFTNPSFKNQGQCVSSTNR